MNTLKLYFGAFVFLYSSVALADHWNPRPGEYTDEGIVFSLYYPVSCANLSRPPAGVRDIDHWRALSEDVRFHTGPEIEAIRFVRPFLSITPDNKHLHFGVSIIHLRCDRHDRGYSWVEIPTSEDHQLRFSNAPGTKSFKFDYPLVPEADGYRGRAWIAIADLFSERNFKKLESGNTMKLGIDVTNIFKEDSLNLFRRDSFFKILFSGGLFEYKAYLSAELSIRKDRESGNYLIVSQKLLNGVAR